MKNNTYREVLKVKFNYDKDSFESDFGDPSLKDKDGAHQLVPDKKEYLEALKDIDKVLDSKVDVIENDDGNYDEEDREEIRSHLENEELYTIISNLGTPCISKPDVVPFINVTVKQNGKLSYYLHSSTNKPILKLSKKVCKTLAEVIRNKHIVNNDYKNRD